MAGILLIEPRQGSLLVGRAYVLRVPVRDPVEPVGIDDGDLQQDHVLPDRARLGILAR